MLGLVLVVCLFMMFSMLLCSFHLFNYLVVLENFNVLILMLVLIMSSEETRMLFVSMMALFVLNISIMLIVVGLGVCGDTLRVVVGL